MPKHSLKDMLFGIAYGALLGVMISFIPFKYSNLLWQLVGTLIGFIIIVSKS